MERRDVMELADGGIKTRVVGDCPTRFWVTMQYPVALRFTIRNAVSEVTIERRNMAEIERR